MRSWEYLSRRPQEEDRSRAWKRKRRKKRTVVSLITLEDEDEELKELLKTYKGNQIRTTKYSLLSFLPRNLFEQLHRFGNVYFIFIAVLNFVPLVQAFQPEVALVPVSLVLAATALKDLWEDYRRFRSDHLVNRLPCWLYFRSVHLVTVHLVPVHLVPAHLVPEHLVTVHLVTVHSGPGAPGLRAPSPKCWEDCQVSL